MKQTVCLSAMLLVTGSLHALDLAPKQTRIEADGLLIPAVYFQDGAKRVFIEPPAGWSCVGGETSATFRCESLTRASVVFALSHVPLFPKDSETLKAARAAMLGLAPRASENAAVDEGTANPLRLNGWSTHQFRVGYDVLGVHFSKSVLLIRLNEREELQVIVTGPDSEFDKAAAASLACLQSWHKK